MAGWEKERELATTSLEFEFHHQFPCGSPSTGTAWKLKFRGRFWTFYISDMNFSSFQAMEPKNELS